MDELSSEKKEELAEAFKIFDEDKDGEITSNDLPGLVRSMGLTPTEAELNDLVVDVDINMDGVLNQYTIEDVVLKLNKDPIGESQLLAALKGLDKDGKGSIPTAKFSSLMASVGEGLKEEELKDLMAMAAPGGASEVYYEQLVKMLMKKL